MSIAGGLFNSGNKEEKAGDTKSTEDGGATAAGERVDLTTAIPGFDDDSDGLLLDATLEQDDDLGDGLDEDLDED